MKKCIYSLIGVMLALCITTACYEGTKEIAPTAKDEEVTEEVETLSKIKLEAEDSALCIEVFESYLDYEDSYADSARRKTEEILANAGEKYQQNKIHIDSVLKECIGLVKIRSYDILLDKLERERIQIYSHPGNLIDNEIGLAMIFGRLYNQRYYESQDSFYMKMLPIYRFTKLHIEALEALGKERHPFYNSLLELIEKAGGESEN